MQKRNARYLHAYRSGKDTGPDNGISMDSSKTTGYSNQQWKQGHQDMDMTDISLVNQSNVKM